MTNFVKKTIKGIEIDVRSDVSLYVTINGLVFYIENSDVAPMFVSCWEEGSTDDDAINLTEENK